MYRGLLGPVRLFSHEHETPPGGLWTRSKAVVVRELKKVVRGCKLFSSNFRVMLGRKVQVYKSGERLTLRERKLVQKTKGDILKMIPFSIIIIVPFAELALPPLLFLFPNMIPSTFLDPVKLEANLRKQLVWRLTHAYRIHSHVIDTCKALDQNRYAPLLALVRDYPHSVTFKQLNEYPEFFRNHCLFGKMDVKNLIAICQFLGMDPYTGFKTINRIFIRPVTYLLQKVGFQVKDYWSPQRFPLRTIEWLIVRWQLSRLLAEIREEDRLLLEEPLDGLEPDLLLTLCVERGIETSPDLTNEKEMRSRLAEWIISSTYPTPRGLASNEILVLTQIFNALTETIAIPNRELLHAPPSADESLRATQVLDMLDKQPPNPK